MAPDILWLSFAFGSCAVLIGSLAICRRCGLHRDADTSFSHRLGPKRLQPEFFRA